MTRSMTRSPPLCLVLSFFRGDCDLFRTAPPSAGPDPGRPSNPANEATLRAANGDHVITIAHQNGQTYFAADEAMAALGGSVTRDGNGFKATLSNTVAAFGTDSRFGVVKDELIEMPVAPVTIDNRPFVPWQFPSARSAPRRST